MECVSAYSHGIWVRSMYCVSCFGYLFPNGSSSNLETLITLLVQGIMKLPKHHQQQREHFDSADVKILFYIHSYICIIISSILIISGR